MTQNMTLKQLFAIPIAIILLVTLSLAGIMAGQGWSGQARSKAAVEAVAHMRLLLGVQTALRAERIVTNFALGQPYPLPNAVKRRIAGARLGTDEQIAAISVILRATAESDRHAPEEGPDLAKVVGGLDASRAHIDTLLATGQSARTFQALNAVMPSMIVIAGLLEAPLRRASLAVIRADEGLSGLLTLDRLTALLVDQIGRIVAILLPRFNAGGQWNDADMEQLRILLAGASYLTTLLEDTIEVAGPTSQVRTAMAELRTIDVVGLPIRLHEQAIMATGGPAEDRLSFPQRIISPWADRATALRGAIVDAAVARVAIRSVDRERQFDIVMTAFGAVIVAVLESVVLLSQRVVIPLSQLGQAITRIAAGDRGSALKLNSGTREIMQMVTAVETLRQAALVADAADLRHRMAARQRIELLRTALGIVQTVQESAHALERGVARLAEGIDATIAFVTTATEMPPSTLGAAADAVRIGLAEMRGSAADLDATFAAASSAQTENRPEAEFVAYILAVQAQVGRRESAVRGFVQPSLVALRDASCVKGGVPGPVLRDLVSDQFERIEETVAMVASMLASVTRAAAIVRDLPLDDTLMAA